MNSPIQPVILCGGEGRRLWPVSRKNLPKQFAPLIGDQSPFQSTVLRFSDAQRFAPPIIVTSDDASGLAQMQLERAGVSAAAVAIEPSPRNTAPSVCLAALLCEREGAGRFMLVLPSDHLIPDSDLFNAAIDKAIAPAADGNIVTFGIRPTRPETGYGWIKVTPETLADGGQAAQAIEFVEKPSLAVAERYLEDGHYLWNAGIFFARASTFIAAFEQLAPEILDLCRAALDNGVSTDEVLRAATSAWSKITPVSFDYAIMEKLERCFVVPYGGIWSDLGDWKELGRVAGGDSDGVVTKGAATAIDCTDSLLYASDPNQRLVGIGLSNLVAIAMPDAVLVTTKDRTQEVKQAVDLLEAQDALQASWHPKEYRPWGWFETITRGDNFQVKLISVTPGSILSLQSHERRSEHWVIVGGTARVTIGAEVSERRENDYLFIPRGERHRLENPGETDLLLVEIQFGDYLGEDDITRYDDAYGRAAIT